MTNRITRRNVLQALGLAATGSEMLPKAALSAETSFVFPAPPVPSIAIVGTALRFPGRLV